MSDLDVVSSSTDLVTSVYDPHTTVPDSSTGLVVADEGITSLDPDSLSVSLGKLNFYMNSEKYETNYQMLMRFLHLYFSMYARKHQINFYEL